MFAEFFLTPEALIEALELDQPEPMSNLLDCFFPRRSCSPALLCKLGGEEWVQSTSQRVARTDSRFLHDVMSLFGRLSEDACVSRPPVKRDREDESEWIRAGLQSHKSAPFERIVVSSASQPPQQCGEGATTFLSDEFWEDYGVTRQVDRTIEGQKRVLTAICCHSDWLLLRMPQIRGGSDDEIVTVKQVIELANNLPDGFRKTSIDVHICLQEKIPEARLVGNVKSELLPFVKKGIEIDLTVWPEKHFINREIIGGEFARQSDGKKPRPRWRITMQHVAVGKRKESAGRDSANEWSIHPRNVAHNRYEEIKADSASRSFRITGSKDK